MNTIHTHALPHFETTPRDVALRALTNNEIRRLTDPTINGTSEELRRCVLGIFHSGAAIDNTEAVLDAYPDFSLAIERERQGIKYVLSNVPEIAFVEGENGNHQMMEFMRDHIDAAVRDLIYEASNPHEDTPDGITDQIYQHLRNANVFDTYTSNNGASLNRITCWGGHSINNTEYQYTKEVGRQIGLRYGEIITGGGPGAMRGPFSGALAAYEAQRVRHHRKFGYTTPGIITSEPPNNLVNPLVILPDMEKRLEAFIRSSMGCIIFPGGPGTAEEIQTILSILLHPQNVNQQYPVVLTGPKESADYWEKIDSFLTKSIGKNIIGKYEIVIGDPVRAARIMRERIEKARHIRLGNNDDERWYGSLHLPEEVQQPFHVTHERMEALQLHKEQEPYELAAQLRRLFSGIVWGNVTDEGRQAIREKGKFQISGDPEIVAPLSDILRMMIDQRRMVIEGTYDPCFDIRAKS